MSTTRTESTDSLWQGELFTACALPGCLAPVAMPGDVCTTCRTAFGEMLRTNDRHVGDPAQIVAELEARDAGVLAQYRARAANTAAPEQDSTPKRGQVCWLCEERRTCTPEKTGWECARCRDTVFA